ncbi:CHASE2 domain-containing protein [Ensifer soli]|uniref:CHASE2 domain-containing protein n=1 Tax=Ciceribacter sp. sgz301302 TaxID=3342379 RepID=UPI0035B89F4C
MATPASAKPGGGSRRRSVELALLSALVALTLSALSLTAPVALVDLRAFDLLSTLDPPAPDSRSPVIVAIDEPSFADIQSQWPWPRALHARLIEEVRAAGARAIGLDIIFAEPAADPGNDDALEAALGPDVVLAGDETLITTPQADQLVRTEPLARFTAAGARAGIASVALDGDGTLRALPAREDGFARSLAAAAGRDAAPPREDMLIQTMGPARTFQTVSYYQALDARRMLPEGFFRDRVVMVGFSLQAAPTLDAGGADAFPTSFTLRTGRLVAGVEVHAAIYDNLTRDLAVHRAGPATAVAVIVIAALAAAASVFGGIGWKTPLVALAALILIVLAAWATLRFGRVFVSPVGGSVAFLAVIAGQAAFDYAGERRSRRQITRAFSQYLSPALVERLASDPSRLKLGGERRTLSILFSDVRGFTTISERLKDDPEQLTTLMNRLLTPLSEVVLRHGGTIDKYIGDCIMAFWNAPLDDPDHAQNAVLAALDMLAAIERLNDALKAEATEAGAAPVALAIGVGINTGDCVVGNMGSLQRFDYSVLGDTVNLAARLEGQSKAYGVPLLIGEATARALSAPLVAFELDRVTVKGKTIAVPVYTVLSDPPAEAVALHQAVVAERFSGTLAAGDTRLAALAAHLPALAPYYRTLPAGSD